MRELYFLNPEAKDADGEIYLGVAAHRFLVEICSGLHSPLFGETEVFGQFRAFRASLTWDPRWSELLDAVEEDVRKLRRTHLVDIGSQSYGSLARRHLPEGEPVVIVGGGHLAQELLPWLGSRPVTIAVREPAKVRFASAVSLGELALKGEALHWLIAAPISNEQLDSIWKKNPARIVLDFRGEASFEEAPAEHYFALRTLFSELESVRELHSRKREEALAFAAYLSERRAQAVVHRPFGWEDAFA
jgi:glutamyl-tRNA reductase